MNFMIKKYGQGIAESIDDMLKWFKNNNSSVYRKIQKVCQKHKLY
jgi:hypothetical protein